MHLLNKMNDYFGSNCKTVEEFSRSYFKGDLSKEHKDDTEGLIDLLKFLEWAAEDLQVELQTENLCNIFGHIWEYYTISTGYSSNDIEKAGRCIRCGYDTHN